LRLSRGVDQMKTRRADESSELSHVSAGGTREGKKPSKEERELISHLQ